MSIKSTGRRGLFGLLAAAPVAVVAAGAQAAPTRIDIIVDRVDRKIDERITRGTWPVSDKAGR